jgi:hypothetical protein
LLKIGVSFGTWGLIILASPNPEKFVIGAYNFYSDPNHRNPVLPTAKEFLLMARGFVKMEILRLNPSDEAFPIIANDSGQEIRFKHLIGDPQDYAVIPPKT